MSGILALANGWLEAAGRLALRLPELASLLGVGSWPVALLVGLAGLALLLAGLRLGRFLAAGAGALLGYWLGALGAPLASAWLPGWLPAWIGAALLGAGSFFEPEVYPAVLGLVPGALLGLRVPIAGKAWVGAVAGGAVLALAAVALRRVVLAATAAGGGAILLLAALLGVSRRSLSLGGLWQRPALVAGVVGVLTVAGAALQLWRGAGRARGGGGQRAGGRLDKRG
jgi:hypothetical protein